MIRAENRPFNQASPTGLGQGARLTPRKQMYAMERAWRPVGHLEQGLNFLRETLL